MEIPPCRSKSPASLLNSGKGSNLASNRRPPEALLSSRHGTLISPRCFFVGSFDSRLVDLVRARGIDLGAGGRSKKARRTAPKIRRCLPQAFLSRQARLGLVSFPLYLLVLVTALQVSGVEDGSKFAVAIRERLFTSKIKQPSISLDGLITFTEGMARSFFLVHK
ncbi:hypothetical protein B296_00052057 [Ensete ventricosum]|uniref:Uncharacterized protein n=1 Tax=Ensete ventricosum TaxID=4639 RepID=A0A426XVE0_ENSVE|nr:hypothetical protein B296_00052057 [Ensete ventricosum]